jgi:hypothetical protein
MKLKALTIAASQNPDHDCAACRWAGIYGHPPAPVSQGHVGAMPFHKGAQSRNKLGEVFSIKIRLGPLQCASEKFDIARVDAYKSIWPKRYANRPVAPKFRNFPRCGFPYRIDPCPDAELDVRQNGH